MKTSIIGLAAMACVLMLGPLTAHAVPVEWTLTGVTFNDGGTATGSFVYDADTNVYSSVSITTTAGGAFPGAAYIDVSPGFASSATVGLYVTATAGDLTGTPALALFYAAALTNAGGTVGLNPVQTEGTCNNATCTAGTPVRAVTAGSIDGVEVVIPPPPVNTPTAIPTMPFYVTVLMMLGLLLAGGVVLKSKRSNAA